MIINNSFNNLFILINKLIFYQKIQELQKKTFYLLKLLKNIIKLYSGEDQILLINYLTFRSADKLSDTFMKSDQVNIIKFVKTIHILKKVLYGKQRKVAKIVKF